MIPNDTPSPGRKARPAKRKTSGTAAVPSTYAAMRAEVQQVVSLFSEVYSHHMTSENLTAARAEFHRRVQEEKWSHWFR